ncbi:saccharopine dehydrogenase (NADP+, L-glutamate-forming) [Entomophthora muscae]|uniref:Saccharopine dehydrogenase (NADP+, L-glutamate-forming) n=1 Tax=Entomophthora muscae TaxID=34485 RepID=A0ACC2TX17_9FUNG|nr:saccharopine dehydrogenase (NADP+, L-glutamate-forming) [Entomophthora muscae]
MAPTRADNTLRNGHSEEKHILLLGSGFVVPPCLEYLARRKTNQITIASLDLERAHQLARKRSNIFVTTVDVGNQDSLDQLVSRHDIVISLIPYTFHAKVIRSALKFRKHVVTTSYISPEMKAFDAEAKEKGVMIMNEIGLDPGVDHVYALKTIDEVQSQGGKILSFVSYCGGLPAPEASGNPLGYKFSWSSRGVLLALRNEAKYLKDGKVVKVEGSELMRSAVPINILPALAVVGYPNRDSSGYGERYNMPHAHTVLRGSLRYACFPEFVQALVDIGFLSEEAKPYLSTDAADIEWKNVLAQMLDLPKYQEEAVEEAIAYKSGLSDPMALQRVIQGMKWLGLLSSTKVTKRGGNLLDTLCATLEEKMAFEEGERDMVLLQHTFEVETGKGELQTRTSTLLEYGEPKGFTAMAKTVGTPCAIAVQLILDGELNIPGVQAPITKDIYLPIMVQLEKEGITCKESIIPH